MKINRSLCTLALWLTALFSQAAENPKTPLLERVISITAEQETVAAVLKKIGSQAGFSFSYNPDALDAARIVSIQVSNKTVREILDEVFKGTVQYKERKKYIILTRTELSKADRQQVSGYVIDEATGERLKNVSIYDPISLASAVTDKYGYFSMEVPKPPSNEEIKLSVKKLNYIDTSLVVSPDKKGLFHIPIDKEKISVVADSVGRKLKRFWLYTKNATIQAINMANIDDTLHRHFQFSFVPFVGTNHKLSGNIINEYSLNALGGYSLGVSRLEVGGLFNAVRGDVDGVQIAGLLNGVAGTTEGVQIAGLINANRESVTGSQLAGLINFNYDSANSVALAGLINAGLKTTRGVKIAGLGNAVIGEQQGPAIAGLFNFATKDAGPAQIAGIVNFTAKDMDGAQVGGIANFAAGKLHGAQFGGIVNITTGDARGAQISGILNVAAARLRGVQIGLVNYATRLRGVQLGLINVSDSVKGVPVGMLSIVGHGYHKIEIAADEIFYANLSFRTGVRQFYNIITAGVKPKTLNDDQTVWTFGYGLGTAPRISERLMLNIDLTSNQVVGGNKIEKINLLNKVYLGVEYKLARKLGITAGITLNGYITDATYDKYPDLFSGYKPNIFSDHTYSNNKNMKMWLGGKIGIRFL